ncbi:MAG: tRNA (adenosine(37)-N6)-dimethylallyltransferase MiaA, partial [Oscillospiraceae bacterium]|nr:tRNA (adenosine(37)-N6)-dimethylallyltransferase MiaA [Oscillospiraceae bacterium]
RRELEARLRSEGAAAPHAELQRIDPDSAARCPPANHHRLLRALEVWYETGKTITQHNLETQRIPPRYPAVKLGLSFAARDDLRALIDRRVDEMFAQGLLDEVRALLDAGVPRSATALQAIGYKECLACLDGRATAAEAAEEIKLRTRQYAKRQLTWLRRDAGIRWFYWGHTRDFDAALAFAEAQLAPDAANLQDDRKDT